MNWRDLTEDRKDSETACLRVIPCGPWGSMEHVSLDWGGVWTQWNQDGLKGKRTDVQNFKGVKNDATFLNKTYETRSLCPVILT